MCRSISEGGRRCPRGGTNQPAAPATQPTPVDPVEAWVAADKALRAAQLAFDQVSYSTTVSGVLTGPLARQAEAVRSGGNPAAWESQVSEARQLVHGVLTGRGDTPEQATAKVAALETAYATWQATPEPKPTRKRSR